MSHRGPNMDGRSAKFIQESGISDFRGGPNRSGGRGRGSGHWPRSGGGGGKQYVDLDAPGPNQFKWSSMNNKSRAIQRKPKSNPFLSRVDESGDVIMDGERSSHSSRGVPRDYPGHGGHHGRGGRGSKKWRNDNRHGGKSRHHFGPGWHKIIIYDGAKYAREFVLTAITNASSSTFQPVAYTPLGTNVVFFVEDRHSAEAIAHCSGRITGPDASKIELKVESCPSPPTASIDQTVSDKLSLVLTHRFNPTPPTLSLSSFHSTPDLIIDYYLPLLRPSVVDKILSILEAHLPTLVYLDLSNNKLANLDNFRKLGRLCPNLRGLDLRKNRLREMNNLERLNGLELHELMLEGNPVCDRYQERQRYVSAVRKYFPKVVELDGIHAPPAISFDLEEPTRIPLQKGSFYCNLAAKRVVDQFVEQFINAYDSDDRSPLMHAYLDTAVMTMHCSYLKQHVSTDNPMNKLSNYLADSRNLVRPMDPGRRCRLVHEGQVDILKFLERLPKTTHDRNSFVLDMPVAVDSFITFTLSGIFKERGSKYQSIRAFQRSFNVVPYGSGFCILNELFYITSANHHQVKSAFKLPAATPTPSTSPVPYVQQPAVVTSIPSSVPVAAAPVQVTHEVQLQMLKAFSAESGMNEEWSGKCLQENNWDYQASGLVFTRLRDAGQIPPEAFVKP